MEKVIHGTVSSAELPASRIILRADGIMHLAMKDDIEISVNDIIEMNEAVGRIGGGRRYPNLITVGKYTSITKEAREFAASDEANKYTLADGYVLHSFHQKIIANFFVRINKPKLPVRFFNNENEAIEWLRKFA